MFHNQFPIVHLKRRFFLVPHGRLFIGVRRSQYGGFVERLADDLQSNRHAVAVKTARH